MPSRVSHPVLRLSAYAAGFVAFGLARWIGMNFGEPSVDQVLYHLKYAEGAVVQMSGLFLLTFLAEVLGFPLALAVAAAVLHGRLAATTADWPRHLLRTAASLVVLTGFGALLLQFSVFSYAAAHFDADRFAERYVDPARVAVQPMGPHRNLILIYVESLEEAYGHVHLFGRDLLAPLRRIGGESFGALRQAPGTNWTIAGMVASQCGVPLKVYSEHDLPPNDAARVFLPGATCLGDLLQPRGWRNVFLGGAPLSFAGKGRFLRDHGYAEAYGRDEWERAGIQAGESNEWGLYDSALFRRARSKLEQLYRSGQPFNLTLLTLDTHNPHGFMSPECRRSGARDFAGIVECTSEEIAAFVHFAADRGYLADTVVVIVGDHLAVPNPVYDRLQQAGERRIFGHVLAQPAPAFFGGPLTGFDLYPTLVQLLGLQVEGGRLGLGRSVLRDGGAPASVSPEEPLPLAALRGSQAYRALWKPRLD